MKPEFAEPLEPFKKSRSRLRGPSIVGRFCETPWRLTQTPYKKQTSVAPFQAAIETRIFPNV
jgi:hypothetical protein